MLQKICRLCPNSAMWTRPTKKFHENKKAYTAQFGFGFEEWLNREEWLLSGYQGLSGFYRYAHVQGMITKNNSYIDQDVRILFYIKEYGMDPQAVAVLENARVIDKNEATWAAKKIIQNKWLHIMHAEVKSIGGNIKGLPPIPEDNKSLMWDNPLFYANIRFLAEDLHFLEPRRKIYIPAYYYGKALDWDGIVPTKIYHQHPIKIPKIDYQNNKEEIVNRFSEEIIRHREISGKEFSPRQAPIQNSLSLQLQKYYAPRDGIVTCEHDRVDIKLITKEKKITFIEIKPANSAKKAIRLSIGQLLEYAHYPEEKKADKLVIVSDAQPTNDDYCYLQYLNKEYNIKIMYIYFHPKKLLSDETLSSFAG